MHDSLLYLLSCQSLLHGLIAWFRSNQQKQRCKVGLRQVMQSALSHLVFNTCVTATYFSDYNSHGAEALVSL